jgi:tripartite ATP-independent transporter DctM subunit
MIVYGLSANVGIGDLFSAGFMPGLMLASFYLIYVLVRVNLNPDLAPTAQEIAEITGNKTQLGMHQVVAVVLCIILISTVMGFIYGGITSVTEASAVGVFGAIIVSAVRFQFNFELIRDCLTNTMTIVGTIIWLILGAVAFVGLYNLIGGADFMRDLIKSAGLGPLGTIFVMMAILVILGTFMEWIAIIFITVPVFAPLVRDMAPQLGMDPDWAAVWFGILFVMNIQIYFLSPPFGPACFWLKSVVPRAQDMPDGKEITLQEIFGSVLPFIALQITGMLLVMFFPWIALWMPQALN